MLSALSAAILIGLIPATVAYRKGRNFFLWWLFGAALFIVALPIAIVMKPKPDALDRRAVRGGGMAKCPHCAELIRSEARVCKHCGREVATAEPAATW